MVELTLEGRPAAMDENATKRSLELQLRLQSRSKELGFADQAAIARISRLVAEIAVLGQDFANHSLPLFLGIDRENRKALGVLSASFQSDLDQMTDAVSDLRPDLSGLIEFLQTE